MKILDCQTVTSTYESLELIMNVSQSDIDGFFDDTGDLELYYKKHPRCDDSGDELLFKLFQKRFKSSTDFDGVYWFHLTRTYSGASFNEGIMPLGLIIDDIWGFLHSLIEKDISKQEWQNFKTNLIVKHKGHGAFLYNFKTSDDLHWGPYAMLVHEVAYCSDEVGNHDYLKIPEIIDDICKSFQEVYGRNLEELFLNNTSSFVVKFIDFETKKSHLEAALYYLYKKHFNEELSIYSNTCFDGGGKIISPDRIVDVIAVYSK